MVWDSPLSHQSFPALGETTPRPLMGADSGRMLNSFKKKTPNTGTSGKDYTNVIDMQESNKFLPISKYSPKMNTRLQSMSLLKQQNIYDNRQKIRDLFFKLRRLYRQGKSSNEPAPLRNAMTGNPFISSYSDNATDRNHKEATWETTIRMACLELRRECKEENIEYCLELFFDEMKEASYQELYPEVFTSFADAFQGTETATAETSTTDPVKSPWEAFARPTKPFNERKMVNQKNFKDDKLSKLEKRFTDKPNLTGSPYKNRVLPNMGCVQGSTEILSLVSLNYTSFLNQLKFSLQKYPPSQEKFLLEFLLVIDSYQFIRNAFFILFEKFTRLSTKYSEFFTRRDDVFVEDESVLQKIRKKYLEMIGCIRIWGFLASLEAYNEDKFVWIEGESTKVIMPEAFKSAQFLFDQIFECKTWLEWAMLDAFLTFASPFLPLFTKQYLMSQIGYCQLKELYKSIKDKINLSISENRAQEDSQSAKDISKNDIYLLENSILEMIRKVHQLQVDSEGEEETDISEGVGALPTFQLSTRRTIKPVPVAFVPDTEEAQIQKELRDWFLKRNPKIKSLIDFSVKILPDFIIQELLLSANTTAEVVSVKEKLTFQDYYKLAAQLAFLKVENILRAYLPGHYCLDEETHSPLHVSTWIFMEMLRPELYRKCSLFIHR